MGAIPICAPREKLMEGSGNSFLIQAKELRGPLCRRAERIGIAEAGLRCFNNPSGNDPSCRILAVIQFEDAKGAFIGRREPLNVIRPERRLLQ